MDKKELVSKCKLQNLRSSGNKSDLRQRLRDKMQTQQQPESVETLERGDIQKHTIDQEKRSRKRGRRGLDSDAPEIKGTNSPFSTNHETNERSPSTRGANSPKTQDEFLFLHPVPSTGDNKTRISDRIKKPSEKMKG